ncbi:TRAP-type C4-dicarboxylate transport system, small permease component [Oceanospirillum multiglobuliferum]|uniref:TRAP transporter small permease protein n=1 Tax=Oceanospirillum multiglobuliferum TaxID=64969 RepID=A0A1T4PIH5_9GAMM|nr:TRAP transporter small permease subunit [Oceanospirillum multiglobuliferum]OPX55528.1 C4-dicarboxylate ABC transporter permease [Oceanospirillum multiglobuliferum]SJZ91385.1 TRAP-type C4-dicarboxylate transport system, small permease component [Oceanospirillum multiglobuliferum]
MEVFFRYTLTILISTVAACQFVQVLTRYVFEMPVMGLEEAALVPTIWLYILGSVNASREDTQIRANVLEIFLSTDKARLILHIISEVISVVISLWLCWWAWKYFSYALRVGKESPTLYIPTFIYESALFLGLAMMTLFTLWHLVRNVQSLLGYRPMPSHATDELSTSELNEMQILTTDHHQKGQ